MSTVSDSKETWSLSNPNEHNKYEKCRNITEEIYKRINITFEIKKLESTGQSDASNFSDQIDSNELSNETDLFACDKSDSLCSSTEADRPTVTCEKYININNNEETAAKKSTVMYKRPRKRFRKRVKKRVPKARSDSEGSSDEAVPLSRIVEEAKTVLTEHRKTESPDNVMGVPHIVILSKDLKSKSHQSERGTTKSIRKDHNHSEKFSATVDRSKTEDPKADRPVKHQERPEDHTIRPASLEDNWMNCSLCSLSFKGERGLKRHLKMTHISTEKPTEITAAVDG